MRFSIEINNRKVDVEKGETILDAARRTHVEIPTLCYLKNMLPTGSCRMCVVEDMVTGKLVPACSTPVTEGMKIQTHSSRVVNARKVILELLLASHPDDCLYCIRNRNCELQALAYKHNITTRNLLHHVRNIHIDRSSPSIVRDPAKCILCGRCVRVCEEIMGVACIDFAFRGNSSQVSTAFLDSVNISTCVHCGQCILQCPTGALSENQELSKVVAALRDPEKIVVVQYAPAVPVSLAEELNLSKGKDYSNLLNAILRKIGFNYVFDTSFAADLTSLEEAQELITRLQNGDKLPMFTSCCPAWVKFVETFYPEFIPHLSSCKSPQQMMGSIIKTYWAEKMNISPEKICMVSIMPCIAKKFEAKREEMVQNGITDVDIVLTTRELMSLIRMFDVEISGIDPELPDSLGGKRSSAGKLFGTTGGVMESALRTAYYLLTREDLVHFHLEPLRGTNRRKEYRFSINGLELLVAVVHSLSEAKKVLEEIRQGQSSFHFIEIMSCPLGCINGGGQHIGTSEEDLIARMKALYEVDMKETLKFPYQNPEIVQIYQEFLGEINGEKSHRLLHTHYIDRKNQHH
ncbi:MAG: NADH-dependent [FeFe] hydrogenase, group A6 [Bacteroidales bacterium]|nr:NADH-dependent [FeFe] hydrogenase, group A6 [Bacteroidales bacterium]